MFRSAKRPTSFVSLKAVVTVERANAISLFRLIGFAKIAPLHPRERWSRLSRENASDARLIF